MKYAACLGTCSRQYICPTTTASISVFSLCINKAWVKRPTESFSTLQGCLKLFTPWGWSNGYNEECFWFMRPFPNKFQHFQFKQNKNGKIILKRKKKNTCTVSWRMWMFCIIAWWETSPVGKSTYSQIISLLCLYMSALLYSKKFSLLIMMLSEVFCCLLVHH